LIVAGTLNGKVAIVTGASAGIGWAVAEDLAAQGAAVVVQARREGKLLELAKGISARGGKAHVVAGDASEEADVEKLMGRAVDFSRDLGFAGRIDIVVVNAGRGLAGGLLGSDDKQWQEVFDLNVMGAAMLMRRAGNLMVQQQSGDIVVLGSVAGHNVSPYSGFYGASKFAIAAMAEAFRREVCSKGVRVTVIKPAIVLSEFQGVAGYTEENFYRNIGRIGKLLAPEDVARTISFVVSQPAHVHVNELMIRPTGQDYP
jgi:NADP-dependent 3-hydroxy acid dehydrogenase YdfG